MNTLIHIIQTECLPAQNCLLTITDPTGDSAFLYFKEGHLIEANHAALWGQPAFEEILQRQVAQHSLSNLPMGIKRTIWEPIDQTLERVMGTEIANIIRTAQQNARSGIPVPTEAPALQNIKRQTQKNVFTAIQNIPGFLSLFLERDQTIDSLTHPIPPESPNAQTIHTITQQLSLLGKNLGAGQLLDTTLQTDTFHLWRYITDKNTAIIILAQHDADREIFQTQLNQILQPLQKS